MIEIVRGDSSSIKTTVTSSGTAFDLTNYLGVLTVKKNSVQATPDIQKSFDATDSDLPNGILVFNLLPEETEISAGEYVYDVQISDIGKDKKFTVAIDEICIIEDVNKN